MQIKEYLRVKNGILILHTRKFKILFKNGPRYKYEKKDIEILNKIDLRKIKFMIEINFDECYEINMLKYSIDAKNNNNLIEKTLNEWADEIDFNDIKDITNNIKLGWYPSLSKVSEYYNNSNVLDMKYILEKFSKRSENDNVIYLIMKENRCEAIETGNFLNFL